MRLLSEIKNNQTDVVLTDENIQPTELAAELDLPFIKARCRHCDANLCLNDNGVVVCLNACYLSAGAYRKFQQGLREAQARVEAKRPDDLNTDGGA